MCSSKRENPWLAEEEPWTRHLCFHPSCTLDYELKTFDDVMSWLDKALLFGDGNSWLYDEYETPLETEGKTHEAELVGYTSEMARSTIRAARENRVFLKTKNGQVGIANARIVDGDLICQLQGCSELVILREVDVDWTIGDLYTDYHKLVGKVHLTGWRALGKSSKDFPADSKHFFEIV